MEEKEEIKEKESEESEQLLYDELYNNEGKYINKNIDLKIFDNKTQQIKNYKLLNEENEILLCEQEAINKIKSDKENIDEEIKIKELYKGEDDDSFYYLNKFEIKNKLLKNAKEFERNFSNTLIDNQNDEEMEKLYKETQLKHPRKIVDGKIQRYSFFSWSGFFCCNKEEYLSLGLGYVTYLNTLKFLIIFFLILALVNSALIKAYMGFKSSTFKFDDDILLKTTLGNTITSYFNSSYIYFDFSGDKNGPINITYNSSYENLSINSTNYDYVNIHFLLDCQENKLDEIIAIRRYLNLTKHSYFKSFIQYFSDYNVINELNIDYDDFGYKLFYLYDEYNMFFDKSDTDYFNSLLLYIKNHTEKNQSILEIPFNIYDYYFIYYLNHINSENILDIIYYSCINSNNNDSINEVNTKNDNLKTAISWISASSLIILIIFYFSYKKSVSRDNKDYLKNKVFINNYTLVLHNLKIISDDYNQEINDLIAFLNNIIKKYKNLVISNEGNYNEENNELNIFNISISNVNEKKKEVFNKIKKLQNKIEDINNDNESIKKKIKNNLREVYRSMHDIAINLTDKETKNNDINYDTNNDTIIENQKLEEDDKLTHEEKQNRIEKNKTLIIEYKNKIKTDIIELHKEYNLKSYADIYITFRNQLIPNLLYKIYNKNKIIRFFYYIFCQKQKLEKYYYKNQWLIFRLAYDNPCDIQWENCYISTWKKYGRRFLSILISFLFILIITIINILINLLSEELITVTTFKTLLIQIINIISSFLLNKLTKFEKYSSKSKDISSDISKYYWLNFLISITVLFQKEFFLIFSYIGTEYYFIQNKIIMENMFYTIFTSQISSMVFYFFDLLKRFRDSKYDNGRTTKLIDKIKYEKLYSGPEFPFAERYAKLFVNLSICLLFNINCPVIYFFFVSFLILTFIVDKYLMINYYRKPRFYGSFLSKNVINYLFFGIFLFIYGLIYNISNPYIFNNELTKQNFSGQNSNSLASEFIILILDPIALFYYIYCSISSEKKESYFLYYNFNSILLTQFFIFIIFFLNPTSIIKKKLTPKLLSILNISSVEIGNIYSFEELKKYYEIKKLQLFDLIIDCDNKNKVKDNYSHLIINYMSVLKYLKQNIDKKFDNTKDILNKNNSEKLEDEYIPFKNENNIFIENQFHVTGDISYNQSFIPKYEVYNNFDLMKNI